MLLEVNHVEAILTTSVVTGKNELEGKVCDQYDKDSSELEVQNLEILAR